MKPSFPPKLRKHPGTGIIQVSLQTQRGRQWAPTGQTTFGRAREVCDEAFVEKLQMLACSNALTAEAISRLMTGRKFTCADIAEAWAKEVSIDLAADTFHAYQTTLRQWLAFESIAPKSLMEVTRHHLHRFVNECGAEITAGTRRARLSALRSFYGFASASGYCVGNPANLVNVKTRDLLMAGLESKETLPIMDAEYRTLMDSPKVTGFWRYATALGFYLGFRLRDVAALQRASIRDQVATIYMQKTQQRLELPLDNPLLGGGELRAILTEIEAIPATDSPYFFPDMQKIASKPTRRAYLSVAYQRILVKHGIKGKRYHSHRHAFALRLQAAGLTLAEIAARMGHQNTATTEVYVNHD